MEEVDIAIKLSSIFWKDAPKIRVTINDHMLFEGQITDPKTLNWTGQLEAGKNTLVIELYDKNRFQTVVENGEIVKDQLLVIDEISFDDIDIGALKYSQSKYYPDLNIYKDAEECVQNCVNLGYNGRWVLEFTCPVYIWLLENI